MKPLLLILATVALSAALVTAGPKVTPNERTNTVRIFDADFELVRELKKPEQIRVVQDIFMRAEKVGDSKTHLKMPTHKIDFSSRWLVDINNGEFSVLSKAVRPVYKIAPEDLETLTKIIKTKG